MSLNILQTALPIAWFEWKFSNNKLKVLGYLGGGEVTPTPTLTNILRIPKPPPSLFHLYLHKILSLAEFINYDRNLNILFVNISGSNLKMQGKLVYIYVERNNMQYHAGISFSFHYSLSLNWVQPPDYNKLKINFDNPRIKIFVYSIN